MNPNHPHYEIAKAWVEGAVIECSLNKGDTWREVTHPSFIVTCMYRVKVQENRLPTPQEVLASHRKQLKKFNAALKAERERSNQVCTALRQAISKHNARYHKFLSYYEKVHGHVGYNIS